MLYRPSTSIRVGMAASRAAVVLMRNVTVPLKMNFDPTFVLLASSFLISPHSLTMSRMSPALIHPVIQ